MADTKRPLWWSNAKESVRPANCGHRSFRFDRHLPDVRGCRRLNEYGPSSVPEKFLILAREWEAFSNSGASPKSTDLHHPLMVRTSNVYCGH
jgi:hypothetical protein